jgi:glycerol uptake facilitator-like aquaporin
MDMPRRLGAEFFGTFWLTFAGCGSAVLAAGFPSLGIGFLGVSLAFGLTVLTMAYAVGHVSGGHFNCAVTIGLWAGGRFKAADVLPYILAQVVGAIAAAAVLYAIASGKPDWVPGGFASNGYGDLSPGKYSLTSCFLIEIIATFFLFLIRHHWHHLERCGGRICRDTHRALPDAHSPLPDPGHQRLSQSGAKHRPGAVRRRSSYRAALAVLAGTYPRRGDCRHAQPLAA